MPGECNEITLEVSLSHQPVVIGGWEISVNPKYDASENKLVMVTNIRPRRDSILVSSSDTDSLTVTGVVSGEGIFKKLTPEPSPILIQTG